MLNRGPTRVVQNVAIPRVDWLSDRMMYAPQIAMKNTTTPSGVM